MRLNKHSYLQAFIFVGTASLLSLLSSGIAGAVCGLNNFHGGQNKVLVIFGGGLS